MDALPRGKQLRSSNGIDDVVKLEDVGGGVPGLPEVDGSQLKNIDASALPAEVQALIQERPGAFLAGLTIFNYPLSGSVAANEIQFARVFLTEGLVLDRGEVYIAAGVSSKLARLGIYSQTDPEDHTLGPSSRVAQTAAIDMTGLVDSFVAAAYTSPYTIPATGFYWTAFVTDSASVKVALTSSVYRAGFLPVRRQVTTGVNLPATASGLSNPQSAVIYVATLEQP